MNAPDLLELEISVILNRWRGRVGTDRLLLMREDALLFVALGFRVAELAVVDYGRRRVPDPRVVPALIVRTRP